MLYERWREIARVRRDELALRDLACGRDWTFAQLAAAGDAPSLHPGLLAFPQGISGEFILAVLRAWRFGQVICPLEIGQPPPVFAKLPTGCVHLKLTSASTGAARAVAFNAGQLVADATNIVAAMGLRPDWPNLGVISLAHSYGFSNLVLPLLLHGIPLTLADSPLPEAVRRAAKQERAITLAAVPALWRAWHEAVAIPPNVKLGISAGAPLALALEENIFTELGLKIHNLYGASECGGIAYDRSTTPRTDATCVGSEMKQADLSVGESGCLEVRGQTVGQTYWPTPETALGGGRFQTSDLVELRGGLVFLRGRAGDQINIAGRKISPGVIEQALLSHRAVRECLVFGTTSADPARTETIVAVVASTEPLTDAALRIFLMARLPAWQIPREWVWVKSLPANQRGKLSRVEWRKKFLEGTG